MRIVNPPDGSIDRKDRAIWLTPPFDRAFANSNPPPSPSSGFTQRALKVIPRVKASFASIGFVVKQRTPSQ